MIELKILGIVIFEAVFFFVLGWMACILWRMGKTLKEMQGKLPKPRKPDEVKRNTAADPEPRQE